MERILFAGQRWSRTIAEAVATDPSVRVDHVIVEDLRSFLHFMSKLPGATRLVRVGFRPGARTAEGILVDTVTAIFLLRRRRAGVSIYWIGTDVQHAVRDEAQDRHTPYFSLLRRVHHLAGHETLQSSLAQINVDSVAAPIPFAFPSPPEAGEQRDAPRRMTVLTYIPDARPAFYGGPMIVEAARRFPDITFEVMGGEGSWLQPHERPGNVRFLGWLSDTRAAFLRATHVARLVEHDSLGGTVLEAFAYGRRVFYTRDMEGVIHVEFGDDTGFRRALASERSRFHAHGFVLDQESLAIAASLDRFEENRDRIIRVVCGASPRCAVFASPGR